MNMALFSMIGYVALLLVISAIHTHRRKKYDASEEFLIADRRLSGGMSALSIVASFIGGGTILTNTALIFKYGYYALPYMAGLPMGMLLFMLIAPKLQEKSHSEKWLTLYDFFQSRFGTLSKHLVAVTQIISIALIVSVALIGGAKMLQILAGYGYVTSVLLMAGIVGTYLVISGFSAVVKTDMIQAGFIIVLFGGLLGFTALYPVPDIAYEHMNFQDMSITVCILMTVITLLYMFGAEDLFQRVYATKNRAALKKSLWIAWGLYLFFYICLAYSVFTFKALYPDLEGDMAFLQSIKLVIPPSYQWVASIAIMSVLLSTIDTFVFNGVLNINKLVMDVRGTSADHKTLTRRTRWGVPLFLLFVVGVSLFIQSVVHTTFIYAVFISCNAFIVILSFLFPKIDKWYAVSILITNVVLLLAMAATMGLSEKLVVVPFGAVIIGCLVGFIAKRIAARKMA